MGCCFGTNVVDDADTTKSKAQQVNTKISTLQHRSPILPPMSLSAAQSSAGRPAQAPYQNQEASTSSSTHLLLSAAEMSKTVNLTSRVSWTLPQIRADYEYLMTARREQCLDDHEHEQKTNLLQEASHEKSSQEKARESCETELGRLLRRAYECVQDDAIFMQSISIWDWDELQAGAKDKGKEFLASLQDEAWDTPSWSDFFTDWIEVCCKIHLSRLQFCFEYQEETNKDFFTAIKQSPKNANHHATVVVYPALLLPSPDSTLPRALVKGCVKS